MIQLSNRWRQVEESKTEPIEPHAFVNLVEDTEVSIIDESWRRVLPKVRELRNSEYANTYSQESIDSATMAAARFVSKMPDNIMAFKGLIDFDVQMEDSVEIVFSGRQEARVNLMLDSMDTQEEAFLFYQHNGRMTQTNGYMSDVIEILRQIL